MDPLPLDLTPIYPCCKHCVPDSPHHPAAVDAHTIPCYCQPQVVNLP